MVKTLYGGILLHQVCRHAIDPSDVHCEMSPTRAMLAWEQFGGACLNVGSFGGSFLGHLRCTIMTLVYWKSI